MRTCTNAWLIELYFQDFENGVKRSKTGECGRAYATQSTYVEMQLTFTALSFLYGTESLIEFRGNNN